jgi:hypothetical protein
MQLLDDFKRVFGFTEDQQVADLLGKHQTTVSKWRVSGEIPAKAEKEMRELLAQKSQYPQGVDKFRQAADNTQPPRISEQLTGYSPEVKWAADYIELKVTGKTPEERFKIIEEIVEDIRRKLN